MKPNYQFIAMVGLVVYRWPMLREPEHIAVARKQLANWLNQSGIYRETDNEAVRNTFSAVVEIVATSILILHGDDKRN